ncbi:MAG TPA: VCBS repeat-containing protein [Chitinophagaceae bacterium]|nr:VCBS repeat-containing protein [Chitinophagaceae bacterium]
MPAPLSFRDVSATNLPVADLRNNSMDVASADIDGDGDHDLVIASEFRQNLLLFNDGTGKFTNATAGRFPKKSHDSEDIAPGDFDKDGDTDIIFVSEDDHVHEYYLNDGKGNFTDASARIPVQTTCNAVIEGDFDKDGDLDIILGNEGQEIFLANDGKGNFTDETNKKLPADNNTTQDIEAADFDKDGDLDLVIGNEDDNKLYLNNGKGVFTDATQNRLPVTPGREETRKVDVVDVDGDGDMDVFFSNVNFRQTKDPANRLLINDGKGNFTDETASRYTGNNALHSADACFVDLTGDKKPDLIVANIFGGYQQVFINDGKGFFKESTNDYIKGNLTSEAIAVEAGDWNKDGFVDLYFGVFRDADVLLFGSNQ